MGLDTSHDCWQGAYWAFHRWRMRLAREAQLPPLNLMEGFDEDSYIPWDKLAPDPLLVLLSHSDCDGQIEVKDCLPIAERLEQLAQAAGGSPEDRDWKETTLRFAAGLRRAAAANESVEFH